MVLLSWVVTSLFHLMLEPLLTVLLICQKFLNLTLDIIDPWCKLVFSCCNFYVAIWGTILSFGMKVLFLPIWILTVFQKEKWLEVQIKETQLIQMDFEQRSKELEQKLDVAIQECNKTMEQKLDVAIQECNKLKEMLEESETQKKVIIEKYRMLQHHVIELEEQNDLLKTEREDTAKSLHDGKRALAQPRSLSQSLSVVASRKNLEDCVSPIKRHDNSHKFQEKSVISQQRYVDGGPAGVRRHDSSHKFRPKADHFKTPHPEMGGRKECKEAATAGRGIALTSSIFSVFLSLLVGTITWQAQDPCVPLVVAVFIVVCMSLKSVVQFLLSSDKRPGFDAVALLSFNWFLLGTLAYPVLPSIAQTVAPLALKCAVWMYRASGVGYIADKLSKVFS